MKYRIARITLFIIALSALPFVFFIQVLVAAAGHRMIDNFAFFQVMIYSAVTSVLIYYSYRFHQIFWFYRILTKLVLLGLLSPILFIACGFIYDGITNEHHILPGWFMIPFFLAIIYQTVLFMYAFMMDKVKN